jgi:hypothetical protein
MPPLSASKKMNAVVASTNGTFTKSRTYNFDQEIQSLRRPGLGRRALRLAAKVFLRLLTNPPLRPFSLLARFLASL